MRTHGTAGTVVEFTIAPGYVSSCLPGDSRLNSAHLDPCALYAGVGSLGRKPGTRRFQVECRGCSGETCQVLTLCILLLLEPLTERLLGEFSSRQGFFVAASCRAQLRFSHGGQPPRRDYAYRTWRQGDAAGQEACCVHQEGCRGTCVPATVLP